MGNATQTWVGAESGGRGVIAERPERHSLETRPQLQRELCVICLQPVMWVIVRQRLVLVDLAEWEPRAACQSCLHTRRAHPGRPVSCGRCHNTGYVGQHRPKGRMVALDVAWSDSDRLHVRIIGPSVDRRKGEALHQFHVCRTVQTAIERKAA